MDQDDNQSPQPEIRQDRIQAILRELAGMIRPLTPIELVKLQGDITNLFKLTLQERVARDQVDKFLGYE